MKVELKIEGPGIQVYCYELNAERKKELEENFNKMFGSKPRVGSMIPVDFFNILSHNLLMLLIGPI